MTSPVAKRRAFCIKKRGAEAAAKRRSWLLGLLPIGNIKYMKGLKENNMRVHISSILMGNIVLLFVVLLMKVACEQLWAPNVGKI